MSKQANSKLIGAFVIGAIALFLAGLMVLGGGQLFTKRETYVIYFPGSVNGLKVGAAVNFRGVTIGEVTDVRAVYNAADETHADSGHDRGRVRSHRGRGRGRGGRTTGFP